MSKERIVINIHYGQEEFKKLFEGLIKSTAASQQISDNFSSKRGIVKASSTSRQCPSSSKPEVEG